jgi:hypothetical protein
MTWWDTRFLEERIASAVLDGEAPPPVRR